MPTPTLLTMVPQMAAEQAAPQLRMQPAVLAAVHRHAQLCGAMPTISMMMAVPQSGCEAHCPAENNGFGAYSGKKKI